MTQKKIVIIGRHGKAPKRDDGGSMDALFPESVIAIYESGVGLQDLVKELGVEPARAFLTHTNAVRTKYTGQARLIGALGLGDVPTCQEDLENVDYQGVVMAEDSRFNLVKPHNINMEVYKNEGPAANLDYALAHPEALEHDGVPIEQPILLFNRTRTGVKDAVKTIVDGDKDLGMLISHATIVEPALFALVNSGRTIPIERTADIGGPCDMEEFGQLTLERTKGGIYTATLEYKNQQHKVDLSKL